MHQAGGRDVLEYWIPAEELADLNAHIVGAIIEEADYRGPVNDQEFIAADKALGRALPDGSREQLVLDLRSDPAPVLLADITSSGWESAIRQANDVSQLIDRIEAGTFEFDFED